MAIVFNGDPCCLAGHCVAGLKFDLKLHKLDDSAALKQLSAAINSQEHVVYLTEVRKSDDVDANTYSFDLVSVDPQGKTALYTVECDGNYNVRNVQQEQDINHLSESSKEALEMLQGAEFSAPKLK